jgi:3'(2'), 5'-bisphosphate nucleotidase
MNAIPSDGLISSVTEAAWQAGKAIMPFFQKACSHQLKPDQSPVTEADIASHDFLVNALAKLMPQLDVISEESAGVEALSTIPSDYWLIDPLDGTKGFLKGKPEFTVNIALVHDYRPVLGVVHAPALGLTYWAQTGTGAWRQHGQEPPTSVRTKPAELAHLTVVASQEHSGPRVKRMLQKLASPVLTSIGSSLKCCLVAEGRADLYFRDLPTMEWDTAAAQCVLETAGGLVLDVNAQPLHYGKPGLKNQGFVAIGDSHFPWKALRAASEDKQAFRNFFAEIYQENGLTAAAHP